MDEYNSDANLYLTKNKITTDRHPPDSVKHAITASERLQTHAFDSAAAGTGSQRVLGLFIYLFTHIYLFG